MIAKIRTWARLWLLAAILGLLSGCRVTEPLPDSDIVFQTMTEDRGPRTLGFVNADGSDLEHIELRTSPGGMPVFPARTSDGALLIFHGAHMPGYAGPISAITSEGRLVRYDEDFFWGHGWVVPVPGSHQVVIAEPYTGGRPEDIKEHIQLLDLDKNMASQTYVTTTGVCLEVGTSALHGVNLIYVRGWLVDGDYPMGKVVSLNTETEVETVLVTEKGDYPDMLAMPAISPDGRWVAYTAKDGIFMVGIEGDEPRQVVETCVARRRQSDGHTLWDDWPPAPSWSPDSQWLVYHRCTRPCPEWCSDIEDYSIFKVNVETGEEIRLVEEGLNPYWRLDSVTSGEP